jgi:hypothetical protein
VADRSSLQSILINLRDAAVDFAKPFQIPANIPTALGALLNELGIADPGALVKAQLANAAKNWADLANELTALNLDAATLISDIRNKAGAVETSFDGILSAADTAWDGLGAIGADIKSAFPVRLLDYILYEALTKSHPKIGGAFLLFGVLRREFTPPLNAGFIAADIRIFDLQQLIFVVTHPREAILQALKWGTDDFNGRPVVDGMVLLTGLIPPATRGPEEDVFPLADEALYVGRDDLGGLKPSARRTLSAIASAIAMTLSFVALHRTGVGILVENPFDLKGGIGALKLPQLQPGQIFALAPGADRLKDPPVVKRLP